MPDLRGIFPRGAGINGKLSNAKKEKFAAELGTYQDDAFQGHKHRLDPHGARGLKVAVPSGGFADNRHSAWPYTDPTIEEPTPDGFNGTPRTDTETRPANLAVTYIVKY